MLHALQVVLLPHYAGPAAPLQPAKAGDAGADLYAAEDVTLLPGERKLVKTGIRIALPSSGATNSFGYEAQVRPRSGAALKGLGVANAPGTIDEGYRGEVCVIAQNLNPPLSGTTFLRVLAEITYAAASTMPHMGQGRNAADALEGARQEYLANAITLTRGDRIAQMVIAVYERPQIKIVTELPESVRGESGFGSTGA